MMAWSNPYEYQVVDAPEEELSTFTIQLIADDWYKQGWETLSFTQGKIIMRREKRITNLDFIKELKCG